MFHQFGCKVTHFFTFVQSPFIWIFNLFYAKSTENTDILSEINHRHKLCALNIED